MRIPRKLKKAKKKAIRKWNSNCMRSLNNIIINKENLSLIYVMQELRKSDIERVLENIGKEWRENNPNYYEKYDEIGRSIELLKNEFNEK